MNTFWWEQNKLLMNDEDIRDGFMKLRSEKNKIRYLERLAGVDRNRNPCDFINLRVASSTNGSEHVDLMDIDRVDRLEAGLLVADRLVEGLLVAGLSVVSRLVIKVLASAPGIILTVMRSCPALIMEVRDKNIRSKRLRTSS
ncbi:unnamed protein product [Arabis nemorensis]|uniref:Uncharacterized protein n=1 Tax=Arabis nemorensis TaxID=586526 RepID=A0A565BU67_9BRAS|nr:unnamed protein product [Arabis nemorensis]